MVNRSLFKVKALNFKEFHLNTSATIVFKWQMTMTLNSLFEILECELIFDLSWMMRLKSSHTEKQKNNITTIVQIKSTRTRRMKSTAISLLDEI